MDTHMPSPTTLLDQSPTFPRQSLFGSQNQIHSNTKFNGLNHPEKSEEAATYAPPVPELSLTPTISLPDETLFHDNSFYADERHLMSLKIKKKPTRKSPQSFQLIQGLIGEALTIYMREFWKRYGHPQNHETQILHRKQQKKSTENLIINNLLSWLSVADNHIVLAHPLCNNHKLFLNVTQPIDASRSLFLTEIRSQISFTSVSKVSKPLLHARTKIIAPSTFQISQTSNTSPLNLRTPTRVKFSQAMSPILYLYISFQDGSFEIWQYGPLKMNPDKSFLGASEWSLFQRFSFLTPVTWFDINSNETVMCIIAESSLYYTLLTELNLEPTLMPLSLTSGYRLSSDTPSTACWIDLNRIVVLTEKLVLRFLHWNSAGEWSCQGYIDLKVKSTSTPSYFQPRIEYNSKINSLYLLLSPSSLQVMEIPSNFSSLDIEIKPNNIHFPVPNHLLNMPLDLLDFQIDTTTGGKYIVVYHQNPPHVRVYLHAIVQHSKAYLNLVASRVFNLKPPFEQALPISMSFAPFEAHSHPILAILWKEGESREPEYFPTTTHTSIYLLPPNKTASDTLGVMTPKKYSWQTGYKNSYKEASNLPTGNLHREAMPFKTSYRKPLPEMASNSFSPFKLTNNFGQFSNSEAYSLQSPNVYDDSVPGAQPNYQIRE